MLGMHFTVLCTILRNIQLNSACQTPTKVTVPDKIWVKLWFPYVNVFSRYMSIMPNLMGPIITTPDPSNSI